MRIIIFQAVAPVEQTLSICFSCYTSENCTGIASLAMPGVFDKTGNVPLNDNVTRLEWCTK
jgi:hypothetical protein